MKWGGLVMNIKLQYFPHFGSVVRVLQKHRAGSPTSGSCCYSASSSSVSEMERTYSKKWVSNFLLLDGNESTGDERKGIPAIFPGHAFLPLIWVWGIFPTLWELPQQEWGSSTSTSGPKACAKGAEATVGPQHIQPLIKEWEKKLRHLNLALGGHRGTDRNGWWGKEPTDCPWPSCPQVTAHFMPPTHNLEVNVVQERSQQWLFTSWSSNLCCIVQSFWFADVWEAESPQIRTLGLAPSMGGRCLVFSLTFFDGPAALNRA